jgi:hypothetical protein
MSTSAKAGDVRARLRQAAVHRSAPPAVAEVAPAEAPAPLRRGVAPGLIRYAVLLPRQQHRSLRQYAFDHDVDASQVIRALLTLLERDPALSDRVLDLVESEGLR